MTANRSIFSLWTAGQCLLICVATALCMRGHDMWCIILATLACTVAYYEGKADGRLDPK